MIVLGVISSLMAIALCWLIVRDLRRGETGLLDYVADRRSNPAAYWWYIGIWLLAELFCILFAIGAFIAAAYCDGDIPCKIMVPAQ